MSDETFIDDRLPRTMIRSDAQVASDYGLLNKAAITTKQQHISDARETRIERCAEHLRAGWCDSDALCFAAAKDEWQEALRRSGRRMNTGAERPPAAAAVAERFPF